MGSKESKGLYAGLEIESTKVLSTGALLISFTDGTSVIVQEIVGLKDADEMATSFTDEEEEAEDDEEEEEEAEDDEDEGEDEVSEEDIMAMSKKELLAVIEEDELDIDPKDHKKLEALKAAVIAELFGDEEEEAEEEEEEAEDDEEEEEEEEDDDMEDWDDEEEEEEEEEEPKKKPASKKKKK
jgi:hypothetical protein